GQGFDEGAALLAGRPSLEHDDLARPRPRRRERQLHRLLHPSDETRGQALVQRGMPLEDARQRFPGQHQKNRVERDARGHEPPFAGDQHRFSEDLAGAIPRDQLLAVEHVDRTRGDDVERVGVLARAVDRLALPDRDLAQEAGDVPALRLAEAAEGGEAKERLLAVRAEPDQRYPGGVRHIPTARVPGAAVRRPGWSDPAHRSRWTPRSPKASGIPRYRAPSPALMRRISVSSSAIAGW